MINKKISSLIGAFSILSNELSYDIDDIDMIESDTDVNNCELLMMLYMISDREDIYKEFEDKYDLLDDEKQNRVRKYYLKLINDNKNIKEKKKRRD